MMLLIHTSHANNVICTIVQHDGANGPVVNTCTTTLGHHTIPAPYHAVRLLPSHAFACSPAAQEYHMTIDCHLH